MTKQLLRQKCVNSDKTEFTTKQYKWHLLHHTHARCGEISDFSTSTIHGKLKFLYMANFSLHLSERWNMWQISGMCWNQMIEETKPTEGKTNVCYVCPMCALSPQKRFYWPTRRCPLPLVLIIGQELYICNRMTIYLQKTLYNLHRAHPHTHTHTLQLKGKMCFNCNNIFVTVCWWLHSHVMVWKSVFSESTQEHFEDFETELVLGIFTHW